jgi:hypothetical protein
VRHPMRTILLLTACLLVPAAEAPAQVAPDAWFFEVDGDYGSVVSDIDQSMAHDQLTDDITDGGGTTYATKDSPYCTDWAHTTYAPYMGSQAYTVTCSAAAGTVRSEQAIVKRWYPGPDSARSLSFAFRLDGVPPMPVVEGGAFLAQLHGGGGGPPPMVVKWVSRPGVGYFLTAGVKYDVRNGDGTFSIRQPYFYEVPITPGQWNRVMIQIDLRPRGTGEECPGTNGDDSYVMIQLMDNATGDWSVPTTRTGQLGYRWNHTTGACLTTAEVPHQVKVGEYVVTQSNRVDYDNISYGKRWSNITKNRLIGYKKSVLRLPFEELSGATVADRSYTWNGGAAGDPVRDYDNDGAIVGSLTRISSGVNGRALRFPGTTNNYVRVPIDQVDFDVGNYMTVSTWFRTTARPADNKGLVMIDEFSTTWKLLLYMSGSGIAFGVRHPGAYSRLDHAFPLGRYSDNRWHLVTGTFNRFAPDGQRLKLYIDGVKVMESAGNDLPILRGDNQLVVGKYSIGGFFQGDLDDVGLFNYTMTDDDVESLWLERGAP